MKNEKIDDTIEKVDIIEETKIEAKVETKIKQQPTEVITTAKKTNCRFMSTSKSRILNSLQIDTKVKLYRTINGQSLLSSNIWYHTDKGYIHSSQAEIAID